MLIFSFFSVQNQCIMCVAMQHVSLKDSQNALSNTEIRRSFSLVMSSVYILNVFISISNRIWRLNRFIGLIILIFWNSENKCVNNV